MRMTVSPNLRTRGSRKPKTSKQDRVCPICSKEFNKAEHLSRHYRSHTKERPFQCSGCGRVYTRQDTLLRHERTNCSRNKTSEHILPDYATNDQNALGHPMPRSPETTNCDAGEGDPSCVFDRSIQAVFAPVGRTDGGNQPGAINAASPLPENYSGNVQQHLDNQPLAISDAEFETGWASWLLCDDFDLDAVNSSLLQATAEGTQRLNIGYRQISTQPMEEISTQSGDSVRRMWHTYCELNTARISPDPSLENGRIDECYREELAERLKPRVQTGILPSTTCIDLFLRAYFRHFQPIFPIVHEPTFHPSRRNAVLLLSICSVGSLFLGSPRATEHGISMFERLQKANVSSWEVHIASPPEARIAAIQSALIGQAFGFLVARPKDLAGIDFFHGGIAAWGRRGVVPRIDQSPCDPTNLVGDALEAAWKEWAIVETKKRIGLAIAIQDAELAKLHHHESILRHGCQRLPNTYSDHLFDAPSPTAWKRLMIQESYHINSQLPAFSDSPDLCGTTQIPKGFSSFEQCAMLESLSVLACESHQPTVFVSNMAEKCEELLVEWYQSWESAKASSMTWTSPLIILWHSSFIMLYANLDVLERACGRDGDGIDVNALRYAQQWAVSNEAKRCLLHAIYILRQLESITIGSASPIHLPLCLYQCGIIWHCFGKFSENGGFFAKDAEGQLRHPEFQLLRAGENEALNEEHKNWQKEWDPLDQVFSCVDVLRRVPHWRLPQNLASTLLALIEREQGLF